MPGSLLFFSGLYKRSSEKDPRRKLQHSGRGLQFLKIAQAVRNGDRLAREEYRKACELLAVGIINVINILNPDIIVLDDEMAAVSQEILRDSLERVTKPAVLPEVWENLEIVMGDGTQESVLQGAALMAIDNILQNPPVK